MGSISHIELHIFQNFGQNLEDGSAKLWSLGELATGKAFDPPTVTGRRVYARTSESRVNL